MAQVTEFPGMSIRTIWIWDISFPVGPGLYNHRPDVMLIQSLINEVSRRLGLVDLRKGKPGPASGVFPPLAQLKEDGWWGPETAAAVDSYQENSVRRGGGMRDGRVDPVHPLMAHVSSEPASPSRILAVTNIQKRMIFRLNADHLMLKHRMMHESEFPSLLQADLKKK